MPDQFILHQNYPNPFNPKTKIRFDITPLNPPFGKGGTGGFVKLVVYDILGREVATLVNERLKAGMYEVEFSGTSLPSGVYFYRLIAGYYVDTKKMILIK
ncbi:MAG: T9SS type A sorting domain-containing protein [Ignavibacteria bacterium]|nr:T9SS type A sorting domain-containing protein [Ignavibacteria bacterium]